MARELFRRLRPYGQMPQTLLIGGFAGVILVGTLLLLLPWSQTKGEVGMVERRVPKPILDRTMVLIRMSILWNLLGLLLLLYTETGRPGVGLHDVLFEQISAFGTVGLSTGLTDKLTVLGRLWITATMFVGRLGPLTLAMGVLPAIHARVKYPEGRIMIG
jgi:trk system potassium uptake protein TrkH